MSQTQLCSSKDKKESSRSICWNSAHPLLLPVSFSLYHLSLCVIHATPDSVLQFLLFMLHLIQFFSSWAEHVILNDYVPEELSATSVEESSLDSTQKI